ncbi:hypothetical protein NPIL_519971 [Nephila pilipes]|uniref:Uncharacterized protein n=1 Tax=Nephila pilipes TaxID=299642 RepID=A0A8X6UFF0_NEPPI|nr:hypothetical protein NPIL_519971 [Nephila pilipes]
MAEHVSYSNMIDLIFCSLVRRFPSNCINYFPLTKQKPPSLERSGRDTDIDDRNRMVFYLEDTGKYGPRKSNESRSKQREKSGTSCEFREPITVESQETCDYCKMKWVSSIRLRGNKYQDKLPSSGSYLGQR